MQKFCITENKKSNIIVICSVKNVSERLKKYFSNNNCKITVLTSNLNKVPEKVKEIKPDVIIVGTKIYKRGKKTFFSKIIKNKNVPLIVINEAELDLNKLSADYFPNTCIAYPKDKNSLVSIVNFARNCRKHEMQLSQDCRWLSQALANIGDGAIIVDATGKVIFINDVARKLIGRPKSKSIGRNVNDVFKIVDDTSFKSLQNPVFKSINMRKMVRAPLDIFLLSAGEKKISIGARATPILDINNKAGGAVLIFWDVTKNLKAKKALEISEENYRTLVESANSIILRTGFYGDITFVNKFAQKFMGYNEKEFLSKNINDLFRLEKENIKGKKDSSLKIICKPKQYSTFELEGLKKSGENVWISWTCKSMLANENRTEMLWVGNDITGLKKAQTELEKAHGELEERVLERTSQLAQTNKVLKEEISYRKKTQNELSKAYSQLKTTHEQLIQSEKMAALGRFSSGIAHEIKNPLGIIMSGVEFVMIKDIVPVEFCSSEFKKGGSHKLLKTILKDGYVELDAKKSAISSINSILLMPNFYEVWHKKFKGRKLILKLKSLVENTSEARTKKFETLFKTSQINLKFLNRSLLEFSYPEICPEFKNSDILFSINKVKEASLRADVIVKNLLKFARPSDVTMVTIRVEEIIEQSIEQIPLEGKTHVNFKTDYAKDLFIRIDRNKLMQVLINIIVNAAQSIDRKTGGTIKVRTYEATIKDVSFGSPLCIIEVKDNGVGIDKENMEHIFEPFFTTKSVTKDMENVQGTGLGLSVSKGIVNNLNGELFITSSKGKGTTVKIALPLKSL